VHKISTHNTSENGSRPLWGWQPQVENHWSKLFILDTFNQDRVDFNVSNL